MLAMNFVAEEDWPRMNADKTKMQNLSSDSVGMLPLNKFGVRRQSEAATALWMSPERS